MTDQDIVIARYLAQYGIDDNHPEYHRLFGMIKSFHFPDKYVISEEYHPAFEELSKDDVESVKQLSKELDELCRKTLVKAMTTKMFVYNKRVMDLMEKYLGLNAAQMLYLMRRDKN